MNPRFRALAALIALIALTLSVAEGVWASTCRPGMELDTALEVEAPSAADCVMDMPTQSDESEGETPDRPMPPSCPFAAANPAGSCAVAASHPAASPLDLAPLPEGALLVLSADRTRNLLLVSAFFRPPRA